MASGAEIIRRAKEQIREVDPKEVHDLLDHRNGEVIVDVREQTEFEESHLPGAVHVPRGHLESRIEGAAKDKDQRVVLYCASGNRSALAAKTLQEELGYENVESMTGGITLWKDRGYDVEVPRRLTAEQRERYSRHLLIPEIGLEGQLKLLDAKVLLLGAGGLGSPTALYLAAAGVGTLGIVDDDVVDLSNLQRQIAHTNDRIGVPKVDSAEQAINDINPDVEVVKYQTRLDASNIMEIIEGYDVIVDGVDNFPTRYLLNDAIGAAEDPRRVGIDPRLRRPAVGVRPVRGPVLPLPLPDAAARRAGPVLRRQRRAGRAARDHGRAAGDRGREAGDRLGRAADRPPAAVRGAGHHVHQPQAQARPRLPDLLARPRARSPTRRWGSSRITRRSARQRAEPSPQPRAADQDPTRAARLHRGREGGPRRGRRRG